MGGAGCGRPRAIARAPGHFRAEWCVGRAEEFLLANGLALLAEPWELFFDGHWVTVELAEVHPGRAIVRCVDYGHPHLFGTLHECPAPEAATLRR